MKVLGLDFETQSAEANTTNATEVGAVLYRYQASTFFELERFNALIYDESYPPQSEKIVELTGISDTLLKRDGKKPLEVFIELLRLFSEADVILAHKISFDRTVLQAHCKKLGLKLPEKEWICTLTNFPWPKNLTCHKLSHLAYEHGIMVDPRTLHRADADVDLMMRVISECYDFNEILAYARTPWIYLKAQVLPPWQDGGTQNAIAKELGFSYEQVRGVEEHKWPKSWVRRVKKESDAEFIREAVHTSKSPFRVTKIEGIS